MPFPQFIMQIDFHFLNLENPEQGYFIVGEDLERKVPLEIEGIDGLNTVYMLFMESNFYLANETTIVKCATIAPRLYKGRIKPCLKGKLWEAGYFANVEILEVNNNAFTVNLYC